MAARRCTCRERAGVIHHQLAPVRWSSERLVLTLALDVRVVSDHGNTT